MADLSNSKYVGKWNGVFLDGKSDLKLKDNGDKLTTRVFGLVTLNFEKQ